MLNEKLLEILSHPSDGEVAIVTQGQDGPHVVNTWNSYVNVTQENKLLIPVGGMKQTETNLNQDNKVQLTIGNREVQGKMYKGAGFLVTGTADITDHGTEFDMMKEKFPWARATMEVAVNTAEQTL